MANLRRWPRTRPDRVMLRHPPRRRVQSRPVPRDSRWRTRRSAARLPADAPHDGLRGSAHPAPGCCAPAGGAISSGVRGVLPAVAALGLRSLNDTSTRCSPRRWFCSACSAMLARSASVSGGWPMARGHSRRASSRGAIPAPPSLRAASIAGESGMAAARTSRSPIHALPPGRTRRWPSDRRRSGGSGRPSQRPRNTRAVPRASTGWPQAGSRKVCIRLIQSAPSLTRRSRRSTATLARS